jgi:hypothetical protein
MAADLTRRDFLQQTGLAALGAAGLYSLLDALEAAPARAALARAAAAPEQHVLRGLSTVVDNGVAVIVPPLHHQVVTAQLTLGRGPRALADARRALSAALASVERDFEQTPRGLSVVVAWGLPYFSRHVPSLRDGRAFPDYLPVDVAASQTAGKPVPALLDAIRFPSDPEEVVLEQNDVCLLFRSDSLAHVTEGSQAILGKLDGILRVTSIRRGFVGGGSARQRSLPKALALKAKIPGAELIPDTAQLFLGFTSTQRAALGPNRIASFETLPGMTDQWPGGYFRNGTTLHLSHVFEDVELWYSEGYIRRVWAVTDLSRAAELIPEGTQTLPVGPAEVQSLEDVVRFAPNEVSGVVGHSASMHPVNRLPAAVRDRYGERHPRGTAILQRVDFNTLDNPFFWTSQPKVDGYRRSASAGLHFAAFSPTSDFFHRMRTAMDGRYSDGTEIPIKPRAMEMGMNGVLRTTHRQNFLVPPRRHRSFPLSELV